MDRQQALAFVHVLNALRPYCPPVFFAQVDTSPVANMIAAVANGNLVLDARATPPAAPPQADPLDTLDELAAALKDEIRADD